MELLEALEVGLGGAHLRLRLEKAALHLREAQPMGLRIDLGEDLGLLDLLALGERHAQELAVDAAAHDHGVERHDRADGAEMHGEVRLLRGLRAHGHGHVAITRAERAVSRCPRGRGLDREIPGAPAEYNGHESIEKPTAARGRGGGGHAGIDLRKGK